MRKLIVLTLALAASAAQLAAGPAEAAESSSNGRIAFSRLLPDGGADVFTADQDGGNVSQVPLPHPAEDFGIARWSPDGSHLVISHTELNDLPDAPLVPVTVNPDGSNLKVLNVPVACFGGWHAHGTRLLCSGPGDGVSGIFSIRASDGGDPIRLTSYPFGDCNACDDPTDVSPDGTKFVFLRYRNENTNHQQVAIYVENIDGTGLRQIVPYGITQPHEIAGARWSPDGRSIISETTRGRLFVTRLNGGGMIPIHLQTGTPHYFAFEPEWSPDGSRIVFCLFINGQEDLYTARPDGSDLVQITDTPDFENGPDWGV